MNMQRREENAGFRGAVDVGPGEAMIARTTSDGDDRPVNRPTREEPCATVWGEPGPAEQAARAPLAFRSLSPPPCVTATLNGRGPRIVAALGPSAADAASDRVTMSSEMTDIFQEVDEEVRRDKAAEFWKKYQNFILGAAVLVVLASAGFRYWQYEKERAAEAAGDQFQAAIASYEAGRLDEANGALGKLAAEAAGGYRVLAQMTEAGAKAASNPGAAIAAFDAIAGDASVDPLFRDAAKLRAAFLRLEQPNEEQAGAAGLTALAGGDGPYRRTAELALAAQALSRGDYDEAGKELDGVLGDPTVSPTERQLAERWLALVASNRAGK